MEYAILKARICQFAVRPLINPIANELRSERSFTINYTNKRDDFDDPIQLSPPISFGDQISFSKPKRNNVE